VCSPAGPFRTLADQLEEELNSALHTQMASLKGGLSKIFTNVKMQFTLMAANKDNDTPEGKLFRKQLHELVEEARKVMDGPVKRALEVCRQYR